MTLSMLYPNFKLLVLLVPELRLNNTNTFLKENRLKDKTKNDDANRNSAILLFCLVFLIGVILLTSSSTSTTIHFAYAKSAGDSSSGTAGSGGTGSVGGGSSSTSGSSWSGGTGSEG